MSLASRLRVVFICAALQLGVFSGVPMRPEQIQALMHQMNQPKRAHALPATRRGGDES
jgi:hypothetical protein